MFAIDTKKIAEKFTRHGGAFDRGSADSYYHRSPNPHYYEGATYVGDAVVAEQIATTTAVPIRITLRAALTKVMLSLPSPVHPSLKPTWQVMNTTKHTVTKRIGVNYGHSNTRLDNQTNGLGRHHVGYQHTRRCGEFYLHPAQKRST